MEAQLRYVTRAHDRFAVRAKLYQDLVGLLHQREIDRVAAEK